MGKRKKFEDIWQTEFEQFFHNGEWDEMLRTVMIPNEALTFPRAGPRAPEDMSWDRRAAWLLFVSLGRAPRRRQNDPVEFFLI